MVLLVSIGIKKVQILKFKFAAIISVKHLSFFSEVERGVEGSIQRGIEISQISCIF